jgi:hypothetical protein
VILRHGRVVDGEVARGREAEGETARGLVASSRFLGFALPPAHDITGDREEVVGRDERR